MFTRRSAIHHVLRGGAAAFAALAVPDIGLGAEGVVSLHGAGSTFSAPLYKSWIKVFEQANGKIALSYDAVGSGEGITRFAVGVVDFGATDILPGEFLFTGVKRGVVPDSGHGGHDRTGL